MVYDVIYFSKNYFAVHLDLNIQYNSFLNSQN